MSGGGDSGQSLCFLSSFAVNLKFLFRKISLLKVKKKNLLMVDLKISFNSCPVFSLVKSSNPVG